MSKQQRTKNLLLLQEAIIEAKKELIVLVQFYKCRIDGTILGTTDFQLLSYKDNIVINLIQASNFIKKSHQYHIRHALNLTLTLVKKYSENLEVNLPLADLLTEQLENLLDDSKQIVTNL